MSTNSNTFTITDKQLQRDVGTILAKKARVKRRYFNRTGYRSSDQSHSMSDIRYSLMAIYAPNLSEIGRWSVVNEFLTNTRIRKAIKYWETVGKVSVTRQGRQGNSYHWILTAEQNQLARRKRKRELRQTRLEQLKVERAVKTAECQAVADKLSKALGLSGKFVANSVGLTMTRSQAEIILSNLASNARS